MKKLFSLRILLALFGALLTAIAGNRAEANGGTWTSLQNAAPKPNGPVQAVSASLCNPLLMTDGSVIFVQCGNTSAGASGFYWYRLHPGSDGNYIDGTWSILPSPPVVNGTQFAPAAFASAVLPDGRVMIVGGEGNYDFHVLAGGAWDPQADSSLSAIYDPLSNTWKPGQVVAGTIGDAPSSILPNGELLLGSCCSQGAEQIFNPATSTWLSTNAPGETVQGEQGYTLLPNGSVLTIDLWSTATGAPVTAEQYNLFTGTWSSAGTMPVSLSDAYPCAQKTNTHEIGPAVLRPDGNVVAFGGVTTTMSTPNNVLTCTPDAQDTSNIYNSGQGTWSQGPYLPRTCGASGSKYCTIADGPAALLPNGNILLAASSALPHDGSTQFFEFTSATSTNPNTFMQVQQAPGAGNPNCSASCYNFLVLPNGQVLMSDLSNTPKLYSPSGSASPGWAPTVSSVPRTIFAGATSSLRGTQLNGLSQGAMYGDDVQAATNYPIVKVIAGGEVFYARTFGFGSMSVAPGATSSTNFTVPLYTSLGSATLEVVANGIASAPVNVVVKPIGAVLLPIYSILLR